VPGARELGVDEEAAVVGVGCGGGGDCGGGVYLVFRRLS
jgi:hypothetical protein